MNVVLLRSECWSQRKIAEALRISEDAVYDYLKAYIAAIRDMRKKRPIVGTLKNTFRREKRNKCKENYSLLG
jgi:predicted transcriptional regulator